MKRKIRLPGEKTEVVCENCEAVRSATWNYGEYHLDDGTKVDGVMLAKCDVCGEDAGLAQQSAYRIRQAREKARQRTSVSLSLSLQDLAAAKASVVGGNPRRAVELIVLALVATLRKGPKRRKELADALRKLKDPLLKRPYKVRVNLHLSNTVQSELDVITNELDGVNRSELVRRAIVLEDPDVADNLKQFALI